ncbi:hypothetical protein PCANC_05558 [Puccinia coronata f. sp. avenae]|uniref:Bromo domain-containing protein n=1 Tax=Puccinia coronata f. sp. avenae TaxID=200324 RepID=A0A2N5VP94_9BASI|nr:hypothetical protein PCASD_01860 [Puccinia coronata f. sp. avenae]PLW51787.1 hypothetical protein PCANC_05558 [Puccinia coronata f. sp. avenae]
MNTNPTRIRIISSSQQQNTSNLQNNTSNTLKRKQQQPVVSAADIPPQPTSKKITLRLRPPPSQPQQQLSTTDSSSSSSPLPPPSTAAPTPDQINQIRSYGLQLWYRIVNSTDADGRLRSVAFMDLPSAVDYPDYYQFIKHPIALNLIKSKLDSPRDPYLSMDKLLSDLKLVFQNAKKYNVEYSGIYKDAHALLKIVRKDPFSNTKGDDQQDQSEATGPRQKKLKLKLRPSQAAAYQISPSTTHPNGIDHPPSTVVIPPTPIDAVSQNGTTPSTQVVEAPPTTATIATRVQTSSQSTHQSPSRTKTSINGQPPTISPQEVERIQAEVKAQTEARSRAQEEARQKELITQDKSRKQEEARQLQLQQQLEARQLELLQQAEAQQAQLRTQAVPLTRIESHPQATRAHSQIESTLPAPLPVQLRPRSPARIQVQSQLQSPSQVNTPTIGQSLVPDRPSPNTRLAQERASQLQGPRSTTPPPFHARLSPSPSRPKVNLNKLRLWFKTILENLEGLTDRTGRLLIEEFRTLPDKTRWKRYYSIIPEPIAFENIAARNSKQGYKDFESFQDDVLRIFKNAQHFNEDGSMVWNDSRALEAEFTTLIHKPPLELAHLVLPYINRANYNGGQPVTPPGSINGKRKSPGKESPSRRIGPSSTLAAPVATAGLRRSSRSPSRPPSALGSPVTRSSRAVSPLPRRAPSPLGSYKNHATGNSTFAPPTRPPSRLANDISPALISIANGQRINESFGAKQVPGPKIRSMSVIPIKTSDGYPPMINRFRITSRPKTMETLKIKNKRVFQHAFKVPRVTETIVIESELNRAWPMTRQLRSSIGLMKVKVEQIRVRGVPERLPAPPASSSSSSAPPHAPPNGSSSQLPPDREPGTVLTEIKLVDGLNLVELSVTGKPDANKNDLSSSTTSIASNGPSHNNPSSSLNTAGLVRESYRLFIYK